MCIGKMSLNITKCPNNDFTTALYQLISLLVEKVRLHQTNAQSYQKASEITSEKDLRPCQLSVMEILGKHFCNTFHYRFLTSSKSASAKLKVVSHFLRSH